ncbi:hypothetical protein T484DRAFT_1841721 [Baffinella frigidus]|nr:hypothetical protein T484DRAFT_1841721 [Cryptophyta sp. CCMP2293]
MRVTAKTVCGDDAWAERSDARDVAERPDAGRERGGVRAPSCSVARAVQKREGASWCRSTLGQLSWGASKNNPRETGRVRLSPGLQQEGSLARPVQKRESACEKRARTNHWRSSLEHPL